MFKKSHFSIHKSPHYPAFFRIVQSVYSHLLGNDAPRHPTKETPHTAIITFGLWRSEEDKRDTGISICSVLHKKIGDPIELISRLKLMKQDYLNKTLKKSDYISRPANELIIERRRSAKGPFPLYGKVNDYAFFYPELNGGEDINDRLMIALPLCHKVHLTTQPDGEGLRADDKYLLEMLSSFPSVESHALAAALVQGVIYCERRLR